VHAYIKNAATSTYKNTYAYIYNIHINKAIIFDIISCEEAAENQQSRQVTNYTSNAGQSRHVIAQSRVRNIK